MIEVSVIIPTYNRRELIVRSLASVLLQKEVSFELIVVDDGSTDGTPEMIHLKFPQVTLIKQSNAGPAAARNRGVEAARGDWMAFLDSDDEWKPGKLAAQLDYLKSRPGLLVCQTEEIWIRNGRRVNPMKKHQKFGGMIFEKCLPLCMVSPSAAMIHRAIFETVGPFDEALPACEDYDLWLRIASRFPIGFMEEAYVIKYGGHEDQQSRKFPVMDRFRIQALSKILQSGVLNPSQSKATRQELEKKIDIVAKGAEKRGKVEEAVGYRKLLAGVQRATNNAQENRRELNYTLNAKR